MNKLVGLICPQCREALADTQEGVVCPACEAQYTYNEGILSFLTPEDRYNETSYEEHQISNWLQTSDLRRQIRANRMLSLLNSLRIRFSLSGRRDRVFFKELARSSKASPIILDLGCGGGRHYFCQFGRVVGIDPVMPLLQRAKELYNEVYQCNGFRLPFADESFDYVVSTDVIGHLENKDKDQLFSEIYRVLKKGGRTIHCSEALGDSPWWRFARSHPELFQKYFIDIPGHVGMELPTELRKRFLKHGFKEVRFSKLYSLIQEPGALSSSFDNEYREKCRYMRILVAIDKMLRRSLLVREALNLVLEPLAQLDDALTPLNYGGGLLTVHEKQNVSAMKQA